MRMTLDHSLTASPADYVLARRSRAGAVPSAATPILELIRNAPMLTVFRGLRTRLRWSLG